MASSAVEVCSNALLMVGDKGINSFDPEEGDKATISQGLYDNIRRATLRMHPWSSSRKRVLLPPLVATPAFEWAYQFQLPADFQRVVQIGQDTESIPYEIEKDDSGNSILLSDEAEIKLKYIYDNAQVASWDSLLTLAIIAHMAAALAYPITKSSERESKARDYLNWILQQARTVNGQEKHPEQMGAEALFGSRFGSSSGLRLR